MLTFVNPHYNWARCYPEQPDGEVAWANLSERLDVCIHKSERTCLQAHCTQWSKLIVAIKAYHAKISVSMVAQQNEQKPEVMLAVETCRQRKCSSDGNAGFTWGRSVNIYLQMEDISIVLLQAAHASQRSPEVLADRSKEADLRW